MRTIFVLVLVIFSSISTPSLAATLETSVNGAGILRCHAYLHIPDGLTNFERLPLIFSQNGTGVYSTASDSTMSPALEYLYKKKSAAVLSIDKPGIKFDPDAKGNAKVDDRLYNLHTQRDLIACAGNAIRWASMQEKVASSGDIYLVGHSEGAQITTRLLEQMAKENSTSLKRVKTLLVSGIPMNDWRDILTYQLKKEKDKVKERFWNAFSKKDDHALRESSGDLAWAYLDDILKTVPLQKTFESLAQLQPNTRIHFFQGLKDENTVVGPVQDFESWNYQQRDDNKPALRLYARYYLSDHKLNLSAINDMIFVLEFYLGKEP